jgi:phage-related protein
MLGGMNWGEVGRGLAAMAGALLILALATNAMSGAIGGAIAIGIVAVSLGILTDVLVEMSGLSWGDLLHGLVAIAAALAVLAVAAMLMEPAIPAMLGMGAALALIGASFALVGVGVFLVAKGFETLAKSGAAGAEAIVEALKKIVRAIPMLAESLALGILDFINEFAKGLPTLVATIGEFLNLLVTELTKLLPKIGEFVVKLLTTLFEIVRQKAPDLVATGLFVVLTFLQGIRDNMTELTNTVADIVIQFIEALRVKVPEIVTSLTNLLIDVFTSIAENMGRMAATLWVGLGIAFIRGFWSGIQQQIPGLKKWFSGFPLQILTWIGNALVWLYQKGRDFLQGLYNGLLSFIGTIRGWISGIPGNILRWIGGGLSTLYQKGRDILSGLWNGLKEIWNSVSSWIGGIPGKIKNAIPNPLDMLHNIGADIINGMLNGIKGAWDKLTGWVGNAASHLPGFIKKPLGIGSPSKVMMEVGNWTAVGFFDGMQAAWDAGVNNMDTGGLVDNFSTIVQQVNDTVSQLDEFQPVITPVLDLTQVAADASLVNDMIQNSSGIPATFSIAQARTIAASPATQTTPSLEPTTTTEGGVKFEQNIYAPEQLSTADIYKNTRNQITIAKEELNIR